jgi:nucleotide-binding universal stress UspA family protein
MTVMAQVREAPQVRVSTVLLPIDFSPLSWRILPLALHVAKRFGATVQPLHIDTASPWRDEESAPLRLRATPFGHRVDVLVSADSDAVEGILRVAAELPDPLLALSTHGHTGVGELAFGSVSEGVLRRSRGPVLTVGPMFDISRHDRVRRILACVDATSGSDEIVPEAFAWAQRLDVPLELLTVLPSNDRTYQFVQPDAASFEALVAQLSDIDPRVTGLVVNGPRTAREIVQHAAARRGTLLAMATHARPPVARAVVGSTTAAVVRHTPTGLLLCRRTR